jgi:hypothetical protein
MRKGIETAALALVLAGLSVAWGQQPPPKDEKPPSDKKEPPPAKVKLEEAIAQALRDNADIRVSEAKLREAEAELHRTRLLVAQKVVTLYQDIQAVEKTIEEAKLRYDELTRQRQIAPGTVSNEEYRGALLTWQRFLAEKAAKEAQLPFLLGKQPLGKAEGEQPNTAQALYALALAQAQREWERKAHDQAVERGLAWLAAQQWQAKQGPVADKLRAALDKRITVELKSATRAEALAAVSKAVSEAAPDLVITMRPQDLPSGPQFAEGPPLPVRLIDVPVGGALQYIEDVLGNKSLFVVREYGLLLARHDTLPPGAVLMTDFWKAGKAKGEKGPEGPDRGGERPGKAPPPEDVEGLVTDADPSGLLKINVGADAGLQKGHTLELFRLGGRAEGGQYLGTVRVIDVSPTAAVCQPVGKLRVPAEKGDHVASRLIK